MERRGVASPIGTVAAAGLVAGTLATVTQMLLWAVTGEDAWELLLRDSRLTAALVLFLIEIALRMGVTWASLSRTLPWRSGPA